MKKPQFGRMWAPILIVMSLALAGIIANAQKKPTAEAAKAEQASPALAKLETGEATRLRAAVARPAPVTIWAITMEFTGSFDSVGQHMDQLEKEIKSQNLKTGVSGTPVGLLILLEEPRGGSGRMAVGVQVASQAQVKAPLKSEQFAAPSAVRFEHVGDFGKLENEHRAISELSANTHHKQTSFPVVMRVLDDPRKVGAAKARIELVEKLQ